MIYVLFQTPRSKLCLETPSEIPNSDVMTDRQAGEFANGVKVYIVSDDDVNHRIDARRATLAYIRAKSRYDVAQYLRFEESVFRSDPTYIAELNTYLVVREWAKKHPID